MEARRYEIPFDNPGTSAFQCLKIAGCGDLAKHDQASLFSQHPRRASTRESVLGFVGFVKALSEGKPVVISLVGTGEGANEGADCKGFG
jgi:hypothetical protein